MTHHYGLQVDSKTNTHICSFTKMNLVVGFQPGTKRELLSVPVKMALSGEIALVSTSSHYQNLRRMKIVGKSPLQS